MMKIAFTRISQKLHLLIKIFMRVIGSNHKQMDMEFSNIQMETDIKVIGNNLTKVESELNFTIMDQFLKVTSIMTYLKEKAN